MAVQTKILHRRDTATNWTNQNPTLGAGEIGFETDTLKFKIGTGSLAWNSLTYQSDASLLSGAASLTTLTTSGNVTVGGDLTVNGTTTTINSSTLQVDDKNLELSSVAVITGKTGTATTSSAIITASNTVGMIVGQTITKTAGTATLTSTTVGSIINATAFTLTNAVASGGTLTFDTSGATDASADGAGITVKGTSDKTLNYVNANTAWTSSENFDLASGKTYKINSTTVLSGTQVLGYSIASANTASAIVARDASGNFSAGTITASLTGTASLASNLTGGTANKGAIVYQSGVNTTSQLTATTTNNQVLAYDTSANAPYWATTTGSGNIVYATSPVLVTPNIGTPSYAVLTSATGYKVDNLANTGTNVITFLQTPTSANFLNTVTGATGNGGGVVFANNATLVAPTLGVASATSLNKVTVTAPATSATLTIADGSTLATSGAFSITLTGTATTNVTLPTTGTLATQTYVGGATVAQANNLTGATANLIPYQSAANTTSFIAAPAGSNYVLTANATGAPAWAAPAATGVTSLAAGNGITVSGSTGAVTVNTNASYATTWTTTQRVNVSSDVLALGIRANTTQTANLVQVFAGDGTTTLLSLSNVGTLFATTIDGGSA
jgi:hypothetical protein